jgi:hypothetical protein
MKQDNSFTESILEEAALSWFESLGHTMLHSFEISMVGRNAAADLAKASPDAPDWKPRSQHATMIGAIM